MAKIKGGENLKRFARKIKKLEKKVVDVGIVKPEKKVKDNEVIELAHVYRTQEEGIGKVPKRATLEPAAKEAKYQPRVKTMIANIVFNNIIKLDKIGEVAALKAKSNIQGIKSPKLSPLTIAMRVNKGTTNPLVDTGQLKKAVWYKVNNKSDTA